MKFNLKGLSLFFLLYYFVGDPLRQLMMFGKTDVLNYDQGLQDVLHTFASLFSFFLYCLAAYASLYYFFPKKKWGIILLLLTSSLLIPIGIRYLIQEVLFDYFFGFTNYPRGISFLRYGRDNLYFAFRFVSFGAIFYLITFSFYKERQEKNLSIANQKMQLSLLRSQINPHFLLNSLNNIYSLVFHKSERSLDALDTLSDMLKYSLYENREKVSIREEMNYVEKFLHLSSLRYDYPLAIEKNIEADVMEHEIPQFILMPLIENAVKHGNLRDPDHPLRLAISSEEQKLRIYVENQKGKQLKDEVGGIGLENIRKRLDLIYGDKALFEIRENEYNFQVVIEIQP
ncbi:MAG: histidine kinase [Bacteroidia bacterium]|nr:histidine kinase [Bacteroidia bacterium]